MDLSEMQTRAAELEQQISDLPAGSVTKKTVNGKEYFYHRWTENKKRREKYIPADELESFRAQIERRKELEQESRHLGLDFSRSKETEGLDMLAGLLEEHVDWELLLSTIGLPLPAAAVEEKSVLSEPGKLHISVARNEESFSFLYAEHLDILRRMGTVTFFNPEHDRPIPQETDLLYLPGGYPENRALQLSAAPRVIDSVKAHIERGGKTIAECGGMMYLASELVMCKDPYTAFKMVDALPMKVSACKDDMRLAMGYRSFDFRGVKLRGHEFHYSRIIEQDEKLASAVQVYNAKGHPVNTAVFCYKNLIASYTHLYWGETGIWSLFEQVPGK